jgi:hypothetical protein
MTEEENEKKTTTRRRASSGTNGSRRGSSASEGNGHRRERASERPSRSIGGVDAAAAAQRQLAELTGREPEGIVALERDDAGWRVEVEVLELSRVPSTTDVLATYEVTLDQRGDLTGYHRSGRYVRGTPGEG